MTPITITRAPSGAWRCYAMDATGHLVQRQYIGYTRREALALFRAELREVAR